MRVLCYSPYTRWTIHAQREMTILKALEQRGADVTYVLCDGLYSDCDMFWEATQPRPEHACTICQRDVTKTVADLGMDFRWLGRYLDLEAFDVARAWAAALTTDELDSAVYEDFPVADWVRGSVHSHLRTSVLDVSDPKVERAWRSYLYSGLVASFALDRLLDHERPDVLFQFNGRQSSTRVALELAVRKGIRVITHESGYRPGTIQLGVDHSPMSLQPVKQLWDDWGDVPLTDDELTVTAWHLHEREHGRDVPFLAYAPPPQPVDEVRAALGLDPARTTWVLFTSSDDEVVAEKAWASPVPTQRRWIEETIAHAATRPDLQLVIRVHPNTGSRRSHGKNRRQLAEMEALAADLPPNVQMVRADDEISTYALMDIATVGLVYHSAVGLELACRGKHVVIAGGNPIGGMPFVRTVADVEDYRATLATYDALPAGVASPEIRRLALRFNFRRAFVMPTEFPLVEMFDAHGSVVRWNNDYELRPGGDPGLDHCVGVILGEEPVQPVPVPLDRARTTDAEDVALRHDVRAVAALAYADELVAAPELLRAWAQTFTGEDDVTLVIQTPPELTEPLIAAATEAGLIGPGAPDLVAIDGTPTAADVVYSRRAPEGLVPRYDETTVAALSGAALVA